MNAWIAQHFFNPAMVPLGTALIASPIIIHLINRVRFRRVEFAAMEFLLNSQQKNRRRILLEQLLLLLLRILIVLAILALIGRMILDSNQLSLFQGARTHHLVILDDSGSMQDRWGETSAFNEGLEVVKKIVADGARRPGTQKFTMMLLSDPETPVFVERDVNELFLEEVNNKLENLQCSHRTFSMSDGLDSVRKLFADEKGEGKILHVISDYRKKDWQGQKAISDAITALDEAEVKINIVPTLEEKHQNLAVTHLSGNVQVAAAGVPLRLRVAVKNFSDQVAKDVRLSVFLDQVKRPQNLIFEEIEAGKEEFHDFDVVFDAPIKHSISVALEEDALAVDNERFLSIDLTEQNRVLIIDGTPGDIGAQFIEDGLAASRELTGITPVIETDIDYLKKDLQLDKFQCIYLLNIAELPAGTLKPLQEFVANGGGLAWYLGDQVKRDFYQETLYENGEGIFPVPLGKVVYSSDFRGLRANQGPELAFEKHPMFKIFEGRDNPFVELVRVDRFFSVSDEWERDDNKRKDRVRTLTKILGKHPLILEHQYGKGRIVTCLTAVSELRDSQGNIWTNWVSNPSFPIYQLELHKHIARSDRAAAVRTVGEEINFSLDPTNYAETVQIISPDILLGKRETQIKAAPRIADQEDDSKEKDAEGKLYLEASFGDTDVPGIYSVKLLKQGAQDQIPEVVTYAYNTPNEESDLDVLVSQDIRKCFNEELEIKIQKPGSYEWIQGQDAGQEIRKWILILLIFLLLAEQLLAYRLSYHPKLAGATA